MFSYLEQILISYASHAHLTIFSFVVSFIEEMIPPIPSVTVVLVAGSMALVQGYTIYGLIILSIFGALGKTFGACVVYFVIDKVEDLLANKIIKFFGVSHEQIESLGASLGHGSKNYLILIILRALPIVPSFLISVGGGLLKIPFKVFFITTFIGSIFRDFVYIYLGYIGTNVVISFFIKKTTTIESAIQVIAVLGIVTFLGYLYYRRRKNKI